MPQYTVIIEAENDYLKQKVKELAPEKTEGTHFTDPQMDRRLKLYRELNVSAEAESHIHGFFTKIIGEKNCMLLDGPSTVD